jgi:hypothetical protein
MPGASCWDKMHQYYIPKGLYRDKVATSIIATSSEQLDKISFQCSCVGSDLYKKKKEALGETTIIRGRRREQQTTT